MESGFHLRSPVLAQKKVGWEILNNLPNHMGVKNREDLHSHRGDFEQARTEECHYIVAELVKSIKY